MGWFDSWWTSDDPLSQLDPSLRRYLEKQSPRDYKTGDTPASDAQTYREQLGLSGHATPGAQQRAKEAEKSSPAPQQSHPQETKPPPTASLYQDGRYAHIWKNYRPQNEIEELGKSEQEKLLDVVGAFKEQEARLGRAALENCTDEQWNVQDCFRNGSWASRLTMCKAENRSLGRCVDMQTKFLRALGYASMNARPAEETERIQMHADALYHRMLDFEKARDDAKEKGLPAPALEPLVEALDSVSAPAPKQSHSTDLEHLTFSKLPPNIQEKLARRHFEGLEGLELEVAKKQLDQTIALNEDLVSRVQNHYHQDHKERLQRLAEGRERFSDKIKRWFDFREYNDDEDSK